MDAESAVKNYWQRFLQARPNVSNDNEPLAEALLGLVLSGRRRGRASLYWASEAERRSRLRERRPGTCGNHACRLRGIGACVSIGIRGNHAGLSRRLAFATWAMLAGRTWS